ncbi:MAG: DnaB-like helicase N-terminal domain-containing protein [Candidatus Acidiferrales bacterium]|jgi:hypothetical protein
MESIGVMPHNYDAERSFLGALLLGEDSRRAAPSLAAADFMAPPNQRIFARIRELEEAGTPVDLVTLTEALHQRGELEAAGGAAYLATLLDGVPRISNVGHYAGIILRKAELRRAAYACQKMQDVLLSGRPDPFEISLAAQSTCQSLSVLLKYEVRTERKFSFQTGAELASEERVQTEWLCKPWVAAGAITEVGGKVKQAGKTTFVTHLVAAVVTGAPFLGQPTVQSPVLYLTEQTGVTFRPLLERCGLVGRGRDDFVLLPWRETVGVAWEAVAERVLVEARRRGARLIVVDTLGQFAGLEGDSENNSGDALRAMKPLQQIAAEGLGVIVVRHERKMGGEVGDSGRGSSAYAGAVDIVISLRRVEGGQSSGVRMLRSISRFPDTPDDLAVELGDEGYRALGSAKEASARRIRDIVLAALPKSEETAILDSDICPNSEVSRSSVKRGLNRLIAQGLAARTGMGRTKHPFRYWATTP